MAVSTTDDRRVCTKNLCGGWVCVCGCVGGGCVGGGVCVWVCGGWCWY